MAASTAGLCWRQETDGPEENPRKWRQKPGGRKTHAELRVWELRGRGRGVCKEEYCWGVVCGKMGGGITGGRGLGGTGEIPVCVGLM